MRLSAFVSAVMLAVWPGLSVSQTVGGELSPGVVQSPILVIEFERAFSQSAFGLRISSEIEADGARIALENRAIEAELTEEELRLTEERELMEPDAFRVLARSFDEKVQQLRREQDNKARALSQRNDEARRLFASAAQPVLQQLMRESNAAVILERRTVFVAANLIDVTDQAIARLDAEIGEGAALLPLDKTVAPVGGTQAPGDPVVPAPDPAPEDIEQP